MSTHHHLDPDPRDELADYLLYLESDTDRRPVAVKIDDYPQYDWLEEALAGDDEALSEDDAALLESLIGEDASAWTYAQAATHLADWCRQQQETLDA
jgi:hypothetical protein